jgi:opacity protein-like surface antigen
MPFLRVMPLLAAVLAAGIGVASAADSPPSLVGTWSGKATGGVVGGNLGHQDASNAPRFKDTSVTWTITIDRQEGPGLIGSWASPNKKEELIGVIRPDNVTVLFVDPDTFFSATLRSENEMEACLQENGESLVATCYVLMRE